mgnify:CR=1 FL=1
MIMKRGSVKAAALIILLPLLIVQSCGREEEADPFEDNTYLMSSERAHTYGESDILTLLTVFSTMYPEISAIVPDVASGVLIESITYMTEFMGEEKEASALVAFPSEPGEYPVLVYQNGTNTLHSNAPSANPYYTLYALLECAASTGYVVVMADYLGFGSTEDMAHPYLHKESTVRSLVDVMYSLKEFDEDVAKNVTFMDEYYLMGYSQGGWSTLALLKELELEFSADFNVAGAVCGAGPYDINWFNSWILGQTTYPMPVFLGYIAHAYDEYDLFTNSLSDLFNNTYAGLIPDLYDGLHSSDQINNQLTTDITGLFRAEYISGYSSSPAYQSVRDALVENSITAWDSSIPLLFTHGADDVFVPPALSENMHGDMVDAGTSNLSCTYLPLTCKDHTTGIVTSGLAGLAFFKTLREL